MSTVYVLAKPVEFNTKIFLNALVDAGLPKIVLEDSNVGVNILRIAFPDDLSFEQFNLMAQILADHDSDSVPQTEALRQLAELYNTVRNGMWFTDPAGNEWSCTLESVTDIIVGLQMASSSNGNPFPWLDRHGKPVMLDGTKLSQLRTAVYTKIAAAILNYTKHHNEIIKLPDAAGYDFSTGWPEYEA